MSDRAQPIWNIRLRTACTLLVTSTRAMTNGTVAERMERQCDSRDRLIVAPGWLLLVALAFAPWAFGCVPQWAMTALSVQLGLILLLWIAGCALQKTLPQVPKLLAALVGGVIVLGCLAVLNAKFEYDAIALSFRALNPIVSAGPGSVHRSLSKSSVLHWTLILGVTCFVTDLVQQRHWCKRLIIVIAVTGAGIALLGALQRMTGANLWGHRPSTAFFATFANHNNAAAFLNLAWPLLGVGLLSALEHKRPFLTKVLWGAGVLVTLAAVIVCGSRTGGLLAGALFTVAFAWFVWRVLSGHLCVNQRWEALTASLLMLIVLVSLVVVIGMDVIFVKWMRMESELTASNSRWLAHQVCIDMIAEAGWWGFGPGTFQTAFPYFTHPFGDALKGRWIHAHQDFFQFAIEWGYLGVMLFTIYIFGAIIRACYLWRTEKSLRLQIRLLGISLAMLGVVLHSLVDFPLQIPAIRLYVAVLLGILWGTRVPTQAVACSTGTPERLR